MSLPKGMDTTLTREFDDEGAVLSGGEFQKIVVARAFARRCPIKVFDEPSSALDPIAEYKLFDNILKACPKIFGEETGQAIYNYTIPSALYSQTT